MNDPLNRALHLKLGLIQLFIIGRYNSRHFADLCAAAFLNKGFLVTRFEREVHTPLVPFGVKVLSADVGVMITASHNPKDDNGYKVYNHCSRPLMISPR